MSCKAGIAIGFWDKFCRRFLAYFRKKDAAEDEIVQEEEWTNPYLSESRNFIEQILHQKGLDYRRFCPVILDTDCPGQNFGEEDDVDLVLEQLIDGLNFLEICTDRPEYFDGLQKRMDEEYGLMVRILPKGGEEEKRGNMVLDFERYGDMRIRSFPREVLYLPFYKRRWVEKKQELIQEENLDIKVPIGYNMLIVRRG